MNDIVSAFAKKPVESSGYVNDRNWELAQRVASSSLFKKSPRLRQFLLFVAERSVAGHADDISEYELGLKVFERGPTFNPVDDSIVRSAARQLRTKVKEYFETEGVGENLIIEIPKGGYVPIFIDREHPATPPNLLGTAQPFDDRYATELRRWKVLTAALAAGIVIWAAFGLWMAFAVASPATRQGTIASTVLMKDQPTRIVLGDTGLTYVSAASKHLLSVAEYANHSYPTLAVDPSYPRIWDLLAEGTTTYLPEVNIAASIMRLSGEEGKKALILNSRQLSAQDFRSGNLILIASPTGCPWIHLFEDKLNFRYKRTFNSPEGELELVNLHPQAGEESSYSAESSTPKFGKSYAILARVPNLSNNGKILLIYGFKIPGSQAAGEYATDPRLAAEVARIFGVKSVTEMPDFEILLSIDAMASTPLNVRVVAHRIIK